jgi:hypothetical protein
MGRIAHRTAGWPLMFLGGWLFNFVFDVKFVSGFLAGWLAHGWMGGLF